MYSLKIYFSIAAYDAYPSCIYREKNSKDLFTVKQVEQPRHLNIDHGKCDAACLQAKELKCACRCAGKNHGAVLQEHVKPLDEFEDPVPFDPEKNLQELAGLP